MQYHWLLSQLKVPPRVAFCGSDSRRRQRPANTGNKTEEEELQRDVESLRRDSRTCCFHGHLSALSPD